MKKTKVELQKALNQLTDQDKQIYGNVMDKHKSKMIKETKEVLQCYKN